MAKKSIKKTGFKNIFEFLKNKKQIFDIGTGPTGSYWWQHIDSDAKITGTDWYFFPKKVPTFAKIYKQDAIDLANITKGIVLPRFYRTVLSKPIFINEKIDWIGKFDMVVANHVIEHVCDPLKLIEGASKLLKKGGIIYAGFPESSNFTDIFYHLIHPENGGHIQKIYKKEVISWFKKAGFNLISCEVWPDDWNWFEQQYDPVGRKIQMLDKEDIKYMSNVFRKELTPEKGYFYGWEMVFEKK